MIRLKLGRNRIVHLGIAATNNNFYKRIYKYLKRSMLELGCSAHELSEIVPRPVRFKFTPSISNFADRNSDIQRLHSALCKVQSTPGMRGVCLSGLSGIGKTQMVKRYFEMHSSHFEYNIIWIDASDLEDSFKQLAQTSNLTIVDQERNSKPISLIVDEVYQYFWEEKILFVFDNFVFSSSPLSSATKSPNPNLLSFLPTYADSVSVITTQKEINNQCLINIRLDSLSQTSAMDYVSRSLNMKTNQQTEIHQILERLGYHPLAIQQFITYSQETKCDPAYYLKMLTNKPELVLANRTEESGVLDYIKITVNKIKGLENQLPYALLKIGAFLNGKGIKRGFFINILNENTEGIEDLDNTSQVNSALATLERFSLIIIYQAASGDFRNDIITIHSLVQQTMLVILKMSGTMEENYASILAKIYQHESKCREDITFVDKLGYKYSPQQLIHFAQSSDFFKDLQKQFLEFSKHYTASIFNIFYNCQQMALGQNILTKIELHLEKQIERASTKSSCCPFPTSSIIFNLKCLLYRTKSYIARCYYQKRYFFGAYLMFNSVRQSQKKLLGNQHKDYLVSSLGYVCCLASAAWTRDVDHEENLEVAKRLYKINARVFGKNHPHTFITKREIAVKMSLLDNFSSESLDILEETLQDQIRLHGLRHAEVFVTRQMIALRQVRIGRKGKALQNLLDDLLEAFPDSEDTNEIILRTKYYIGRVYLTRGWYKEALQIFDVVYNGWLILYGDSHSDVLEVEKFIMYLKNNQG